MFSGGKIGAYSIVRLPFSSGFSLEAETLDYQSRIIAAGSSISDSSLLAHDAFIKTLKSSNTWNSNSLIWTCAGNSLAGALVYLKYPAGMQSSATNVGFVSGDYSEANGLSANGSQYLKSGWIPSNQLVTSLNAHFGFYSRTTSTAATVTRVLGSTNATGDKRFVAQRSGATTVQCFIGSGTENNLSNTSATLGGWYCLSNIAANDGTIYKNSTPTAIDSSFTTNALPTVENYIYAYNLDNTLPANNRTTIILTGVMFGSGLTSAQNTTVYNAMQTLQTALGRQV